MGGIREMLRNKAVYLAGIIKNTVRPQPGDGLAKVEVSDNVQVCSIPSLS